MIPCARTLKVNGEDVRCHGHLLPFSDYGRADTQMMWKAHVCSNEQCGFGVAIDNGKPGYIEKVGKRAEKPNG